ncbi:hypothetical protein [Halomonas sp. PA16-9]|uniref:hypothetical protein n=1 Tax=Halomonas sp. PA16-9 TaxID=2576841 RepID=UPI0030EF0277
MRDKVAIEVWDGWLRLFHWGLVAAVLISFYTPRLAERLSYFQLKCMPKRATS